MAKEEDGGLPRPYQFGNTDRFILLSILTAALFLTGSVGIAALDYAANDSMMDGALTTGGDRGVGPVTAPIVGEDEEEETEEEESNDSKPVAIATGIFVGIALVIVSECFTVVLVLIVLTIIFYVVYRLMAWLEKKCKKCKCCRWPSCWGCCVKKLFCWIIWVVKWVALVLAIVFAISTVVTFVYCIFTAVAAMFA